MHDRLFDDQKALVPVKPHAEAIGLDVAAFEECMGSGRHAKAIRSDMAQASAAGVTGTPGFIVAETDPKDPSKVKGKSFIRGAQPFSAFKSALDAALADLE